MGRGLRGWRLLLFAHCEDASRTESDEWDGPVESDRWWAARLHRLACGSCRHEARRLRWLRRMLSSAPDDVRAAALAQSETRLSAEAADRIRTALAEARDADSAE